MNLPPTRHWSPKVVSLLISLAVFGIVMTLRQLGRLQFLEFRAYDQFLNWRAEVSPSDPRIVLIGVTEEDLRNPALDYPIWDDKLALVLERLARYQPRAIGLDIYRDLPVPKSGEHLHALNEVLITNQNIVCIWKFGDAAAGGVPPAPILKLYPDRIGFNDFPVDSRIYRTVRRGLLYIDDGTNSYRSFALQLALLYLGKQGIEEQADPHDETLLRLGRAAFRPFRGNDGAYINADARGYQFLLDFKGPRTFTTYSFGQAFSNQIPEKAIHDKIVLVGVTADSVKDNLVTPLRDNHRGLEVLAQLVNQLLRAALDGDLPISVWKEWQEAAWILGWCLIGGGIGLFVRSPWQFSLWTILSLSVLGLGAWCIFNLGWWIPLVAPAAAFFPAAALVTSYVSHSEKIHRAQLMQLFSKHVSPDVAETIWSQRDVFLQGNRPRAQRITATVLFTDLSKFTSLSESSDPGVLMDWLNEYMEAMAKVVMRNGGMVDKYIGDAIMAVFGVPIARTSEEQVKQDAINAVCCALEMRKELMRLNAQWKERGLPTTTMRVGIHTGTLLAGSLGSAERMDYTVLGDTVNTAQRLESFRKETTGLEFPVACCRILIGESTYVLLDSRFEAKLLGKMELHGKQEKVNVYHVIDQVAVTEGIPK